MVRIFLRVGGIVIVLGLGAFLLLPPKGSVPVLMYHFVVPDERVGPTSLDVSTTRFEQQMWFLSAFGYRPISLKDLYEIKMGNKKAQGREVVVTFDDGNETYPKFALPILEKYQIPSANFLIVENLTDQLHGSMDVETAKQLAKHPLVTLGSHTITHPVLPEINIQQALREIDDSRKHLTRLLEITVDFFTYPTGQLNDTVVDFVRDAGYRLAFTTSKKRLKGTQGESVYSLTRIKVNPGDHLLIFWFKLSFS